MKTLGPLLLFAATLGLSSCSGHHDHGPTGQDGLAYYGVDYDHAMPYSYWDNNPTVPDNPYFGEFYRTEPASYDFEYFINPTEYWYGSYHIEVERGRPGGPHGEVGEDGLDTYLVLFLDPEGWSEDRFASKSNVTIDQSVDHFSITINGEEETISIEMQRTDISKRPAENGQKILSEQSGMTLTAKATGEHQ